MPKFQIRFFRNGKPVNHYNAEAESFAELLDKNIVRPGSGADGRPRDEQYYDQVVITRERGR